MANIMAGVSKVSCIVFILVLAILLWKTGEYFNTLPEKEKGKPIIAWNMLVILFTLIALVMRLLGM